MALLASSTASSYFRRPHLTPSRQINTPISCSRVLQDFYRSSVLELKMSAWFNKKTKKKKTIKMALLGPATDLKVQKLS